MTEGENMLERLGRAVFDAQGSRATFGREYVNPADYRTIVTVDTWENAPERRAECLKIARAVIEALMTPTPEMLLACWPNHHPWGQNAPPPDERPHGVERMTELVRADWQAMLRTASIPNEEGEGK